MPSTTLITDADFFSKQYQVATLAGLLEMSPSNVYQWQQRGILPKKCSYRRAIQASLDFWKAKADKGAGNIVEIAAVRKAELDRGKTIKVWYEIKAIRKDFIDLESFLEIAEPHFISLRSELLALVKRYPALSPEIDDILENFATLGKQLASKSDSDFDSFVDEQISIMDNMEEDIAEATKLLEVEK